METRATTSNTGASDLCHGNKTSGAVVDRNDPLCRNNPKRPNGTGDKNPNVLKLVKRARVAGILCSGPALDAKRRGSVPKGARVIEVVPVSDNFDFNLLAR